MALTDTRRGVWVEFDEVRRVVVVVMVVLEEIDGDVKTWPTLCPRRIHRNKTEAAIVIRSSSRSAWASGNVGV